MCILVLWIQEEGKAILFHQVPSSQSDSSPITFMRISLSRGSLMGGSVFVFFLPIGWFSDHPYENQPFGSLFKS